MGSSLNKTRRKSSKSESQEIYILPEPCTDPRNFRQIGTRNSCKHYRGAVGNNEELQEVFVSALSLDAATLDRSHGIHDAGEYMSVTDICEDSSKRNMPISETALIHGHGKLNDDSGCGSTCSSRNGNRNRQTLKENELSNLKTNQVHDPIRLLPSMVEVFRPLIVDCVRVTEILPYLLLPVDKGKIWARNKFSDKEAASLLLDEVIGCQEEGKWTAFLDALKEAGYKYVSDVLKGATEKDFSSHKKILQILTPHIMENLEPTELIEILFSKGVISTSDKEELERTQKFQGPSAATLILLDRIPRRHPDWYAELKAALEACGCEYLAEDIDIEHCKDNNLSKDNHPITQLHEDPPVIMKEIGKEKMASRNENFTPGGIVVGEKVKQPVDEMELLIKKRDEIKQKLQRRKKIAALKEEIKDLENDFVQLDMEEDEKQSLQEKDRLIKMRDRAKRAAQRTQEIMELKCDIEEIENVKYIGESESKAKEAASGTSASHFKVVENKTISACLSEVCNTTYLNVASETQESISDIETTQEQLPMDAQNITNVDVAPDNYARIDDTCQSLIEPENILRQILREEIISVIKTHVLSEISKALNPLNNDDNSNYVRFLQHLKVYESTCQRTDTAAQTEAPEVVNDYDIVT